MLDGARDSDGYVQFRCDDLPGLTDLHVIGHHAGIDRSPRGADGGAHLVRQIVEHLEVVAALHAAPAADDDLGAGQLGPVRLAQLLPDPFRVGGGIRADLVLCCAAAGALVRVEGGGAHRQDLDGVLAPQGHDGVARVDGSDERLGVLDADDVRDGGDVELGRDARQHRAADGGRPGQNVAELELLLRGQHDRRKTLRKEAVVGGRLGHNDL